MIFFQLLTNGLVTGCALGLVAVSFSLVHSTTGIFHVAHAGVFTLAGYVAYQLSRWGAPLVVSIPVAMTVCAAVGAATQAFLYGPMERRRATSLVILIASLGLLAVIVNTLAAVFTANVLTFPVPWASRIVTIFNIRFTNAQIITVILGLIGYAAVMLFAHGTTLGKRIRAVATNPVLAEITRLEPKKAYVIVLAIASALVAVPGVLIHLDLGLQPYNGVNVLLIATIAMIAGGSGSITGSFVMAIAIAVLQNLSLLFIPSIWNIAVTFFVFVIFMLFRPTGLFVAR
jgi:branched-chain amino acid transport system permease protein